MSEETSDYTGCVMKQAVTPQEKCSQEHSPADDATADELFESFMEIANDPELHTEQTDTQKEATSESIGASDPSALQVKDINSSVDEQRDAANDQGETNFASDPSVSQYKDINSSSDGLQTDTQNGTNDQNEMIETDKKSTPNGTPDQSETTVGESADLTMSQVKDVSSNTDEQTCSQTSGDVESVDSTTSNPTCTTGQLNSDDNPVQSATEEPVESSEQAMPNPGCDESKPEEISATTDNVQSSSDATNEVDGTEASRCGTESLETSSESSDAPLPDNKEVLPDPTKQVVDSALSSNDIKEPTSDHESSTSEADAAKRLSKAVEDLAGLEQQLSSAVTEMKRTNSEKKFTENNDGKEQSVETQEGKKIEDPIEGHLALQTTVTDNTETKEVDELVVNEAASQDSEECVVLKTDEICNVPSVQDIGGEATVCDADVDLNAVSVDSNNEETLIENTEQNGKDAVDNIYSDSKGTHVDVTKVQEVKMENSKSGESDMPPANEDLKVESNELGTSETQDVQITRAEQEVELKAPLSTEESQVETIAEESKNDKEEKSDSADELDMEIAKVCMSIPDIEITTDESGISESKSLDSLDTKESSNSPPASPAVSDEDIDSDTPSDYGDDDDDDGTFEPDNLGASRRKSWLLETDRNRLSSDSSTLSERDFKENYDKGDNADGKPPKEDYIRGHLLKMGGTGLTPKNWRKRWFVLQGDNCLYYYKQSKDKVPCGVIILSNYSVSKAPEINKNHCFKLTKGGARTYYMCAGSDSDMKKWIMALVDAIKGSSGSFNPFNLLEGNVHNVSIPALSIRDPDCHGYLYKQGHNIKTWRRRYFVLKNGFLYYYSDMSNTVALGVAKLLHYTIQMGDQTGKKFCFSAVSSNPSSRTYFFAAESEMDRTRWSSKLEESIKKGSLVT